MPASTVDKVFSLIKGKALVRKSVLPRWYQRVYGEDRNVNQIVRDLKALFADGTVEFPERGYVSATGAVPDRGDFVWRSDVSFGEYFARGEFGPDFPGGVEPYVVRVLRVQPIDGPLSDAEMPSINDTRAYFDALRSEGDVNRIRRQASGVGASLAMPAVDPFG